MCDPVTAVAISGVVSAGTALYQGRKARDQAREQQKKAEASQAEAERIAAIPKPTLEDPTKKDTEAERRRRVSSLQFGMASTIKTGLDKKNLGFKTKLGQ